MHRGRATPSSWCPGALPCWQCESHPWGRQALAKVARTALGFFGAPATAMLHSGGAAMYGCWTCWVVSLLKVIDRICSRCPLQNVMSTAAERRKTGKKGPLEFTLKYGAVKPDVIISQQCFGPLSGLTASGLQAALLNAAADLLQMLSRDIAIICQQYKSPLLPSGL